SHSGLMHAKVATSARVWFYTQSHKHWRKLPPLSILNRVGHSAPPPTITCPHISPQGSRSNE
ncbi:MAG: hypothetical protein N6V49_08905, partial [Serratia symbiotica]|nr:hypothetical protein [Serratia symbiotica]